MAEALRDIAGLEKSIRNFDTWLGGVVSGGMDLDYICERRGNFLVIEGKPWMNGVRMGFGQHRTLEQLSQQPSTTVLLVGESSDRIYLHEYGSGRPTVSRPNGRLVAFFWPHLFEQSDLNGLRNYVEEWWEACSVE